MAKSRVTLAGVVGHDPEQRTTPAGGEVVKFRLGVTERTVNAAGTWVDGATSWFQVDAWGTLGKNTAASIRKGQRVLVHGVLSVREFQARDGSRGKEAEIRAESIGHDLVFGTTRFERVSRGQAAPPAVPAAAPVPALTTASAQAAPPVDHSNEWAAPGTTDVLDAADEFVETPF